MLFVGCKVDRFKKKFLHYALVNFPVEIIQYGYVDFCNLLRLCADTVSRFFAFILFCFFVLAVVFLSGYF